MSQKANLRTLAQRYPQWVDATQPAEAKSVAADQTWVVVYYRFQPWTDQGGQSHNWAVVYNATTEQLLSVQYTKQYLTSAPDETAIYLALSAAIRRYGMPYRVLAANTSTFHILRSFVQEEPDEFNFYISTATDTALVQRATDRLVAHIMKGFTNSVELDTDATTQRTEPTPSVPNLN